MQVQNPNSKPSQVPISLHAQAANWIPRQPPSFTMNHVLYVHYESRSLKLQAPAAAAGLEHCGGAAHGAAAADAKAQLHHVKEEQAADAKAQLHHVKEEQARQQVQDKEPERVGEPQPPGPEKSKDKGYRTSFTLETTEREVSRPFCLCVLTFGAHACVGELHPPGPEKSKRAAAPASCWRRRRGR